MQVAFGVYAAKPNLPGLGVKIRAKNGQLNDPAMCVDAGSVEVKPSL